MQYDSFAAFLQMGGYGFFVWGAYLVCSMVLLALVIEPAINKRRLFKQLEKRAARERRIEAAKELKDRL